MGWLDKSISKQRSFIEGLLLDPLSKLADICVDSWSDRKKLDQSLKAYLQAKTDHRCSLLYAIDIKGLQYSSNISKDMVDEAIIGQDLSHRPYLKSIDNGSETQLLLSDVYIDKQTRKPCITVLHEVRSNHEVIGYIAADFGLKDLPLKNVNELQSYEWRQIKGDPSIRGTMFQQTRVRSSMDQHIDEVLDVVESLMTEQGVFHVKLHFSSSRATLWSYSDPYRYRLHVLDEIINPKVCLVYEKVPYPEQALVTAGMVHNVLKAFKLLRDADETIYLRAASLNIMNGLVGLNFSCDGSHYMPANEFLEKDLRFWFGEETICVNA
ncbi:MAG: hypothetical protein KJN89_03405 [Gammaproteobacteria bacterium]|nr:hypothetical protein [Gammaproteobacteria bacterium]MBT8134723.1 hypothetical protein [Gammaproteobacteria bacterium]NNJ49398.1 hypothetical protein [Gammaproteobacteria bacterium]